MYTFFSLSLLSAVPGKEVQRWGKDGGLCVLHIRIRKYSNFLDF